MNRIGSRSAGSLFAVRLAILAVARGLERGLRRVGRAGDTPAANRPPLVRPTPDDLATRVVFECGVGPMIPVVGESRWPWDPFSCSDEKSDLAADCSGSQFE